MGGSFVFIAAGSLLPAEECKGSSCHQSPPVAAGVTGTVCVGGVYFQEGIYSTVVVLLTLLISLQLEIYISEGTHSTEEDSE